MLKNASPLTRLILGASMLIVAAGFALLAAASCGDDGGGDPVPTPPGEFRGGGADATVEIAGETFEYSDGICEDGGDGRYLEVNIGNPAADEYFGLILGMHPGLEGATKPVSDGGEFRGNTQARMNLRYDNEIYLPRFDDTVVTLGASGRAGTFSGLLTRTDDDGNPLSFSGSFSCPQPSAATPTPAP